MVMRKGIIFLIVLLAMPLFSNFIESETNEFKTKEISLEIRYTVQNERGSAEHKGRMLINNYSQIRYDEIQPQRCTFILNNGNYQYYDYNEKKLFKSKISDMSFDHQVIVGQIFNFEIIYPLEYLKGKYIFQKNDEQDFVWGSAKGNPYNKVKIIFKKDKIEQIDFYNKGALSKKIVFISYYEKNGLYFPERIKIEIIEKPHFIIDFYISSIKYQQNILENINEKL